MVKIENTFTVNVYDCRGKVNLFIALKELGILSQLINTKVLIIAGSEYAYSSVEVTSSNMIIDNFDVEYYADICRYDVKSNEFSIVKENLKSERYDMIVIYDLCRIEPSFLQGLYSIFNSSNFYLISDASSVYKSHELAHMFERTPKYIFTHNRNYDKIISQDMFQLTRNILTLAREYIKMSDLKFESDETKQLVQLRGLEAIDTDDMLPFDVAVSFVGDVSKSNMEIRRSIGYETLIPKISEKLIIREDTNVKPYCVEDGSVVITENLNRKECYLPEGSIVKVLDTEMIGGNLMIICSNFKNDIFKLFINLEYMLKFMPDIDLGSDELDINNNGIRVSYAYVISPRDTLGKMFDSMYVIFSNMVGDDTRHILYNILSSVKNDIKIASDFDYFIS